VPPKCCDYRPCATTPSLENIFMASDYYLSKI
jgi:hypothetical protein